MTAWRRPAVVRGLAAVLLLWACQMAGAVEPERGPRWATLSPAQQQVLAPLGREWHQIDAARKQKWLEVASRFPTLPMEERARIQARMAEWARMSPAERGRARLQFQETRLLSPAERQARWLEYQALPDDQRRKLVQTAKAQTSPAAIAASTASPRPSQAASGAKESAATPRSPTLAKGAPPIVVQAKPGATTSTMTTKPSPPAHQQTGLPKIAATPDFVDPATLLPKRGPQAAAAAEADKSP